ncbi:Cyanide-insensitive ubiquinol oxidase, subunit II [uncultured Stenotrophomonas sp.]|uniref:Cyanide-insensitive ubiquinol oxidase, subunit II n=1 Tax=uncultured Stenotrophomonas sp. TaxID=165438 RepID=A0A1Y5Q5I8_9GAMM|nr:Cyanide-insensitive ubiquinol oxidase, subunit II [uncultured Stenotrophomonas sp.]
MDVAYWLPVAWFAVIAFGVFMYVVLDGFVLGLGILAPLARDDAQLDAMMNTAAPIWDGNETWLVLGGAGLLAAFPAAYATLLPALYLPVLLMLIALVFRGVAFEFRFKATRTRWIWGWAFAAGSICAAFWQGVILGALVRGLPVGGGAWAWLDPFALLTGVALMAGYALLGATWLILKTTAGVQVQARRLARPLVLAVAGFMAVVSICLPFLDSRVMARWFAGNNFWWLSPVPVLVAVNVWLLWKAAAHPRRDAHPFLLALALFALGYAGLLLGLWPWLVPPSLTLWQAAAPPSSQGFMLVGVACLLPLILGYTAWSWYVFRGKLQPGQGYH